MLQSFSVPFILENNSCWILHPWFILSFFDYLKYVTPFPSEKKHCCGENGVAISFSFPYNSSVIFSGCPNNFPFLSLSFPSRYRLILVISGWYSQVHIVFFFSICILNIYICIYIYKFLFNLSLLCSMWDFSSLSRDQTCTSCIEAWSLNTGPPGKSLYFTVEDFFLSYSF